MGFFGTVFSQLMRLSFGFPLLFCFPLLFVLGLLPFFPFFLSALAEFGWLLVVLWFSFCNEVPSFV
jgi:hypothetical protein